MSLSRIGSIDGLERARESSISQPRRLSFNPIDLHVSAPMDRKEDLAAELVFDEVPKGKRAVQVVIAIIYCLFAAGVVFGYAAIKPVLIREGVFAELCSVKEAGTPGEACNKQEIKLNFMFTLAAVSTNVAALPIGTILDRYGPRVCGLMGSIFLLIGTLLFSFAKSMSVDGYTPGYFFLALGGPFVFISSFQLSNTFPHRSGLILALLTGAFDSSSALFLIFRLISEATDGRIDLHKLFLIYVVVPIFIFVVQVFIMPKESYKSVSDIVKEAEDDMNAPTPPEFSVEQVEALQRRRESVASEVQTLLETGTNAKRAKREDNKNKKSGVWGVLHGYSALEQMKTPWFWLITMFTVIQMTRINYFVATIRSQEQWLLGTAANAKFVNDFFDVALPLGGVFSIPFIGTLLDNTSTPFAMGFLVVAATIIGILGCLPYMWAAIANVCLFVVYRPFYYTTVSDYSAKVFGFQTFGKVYGLIICLAGLFNFAQSPLDFLTHGVFNDNPIPINAALTTIAVLVGGSLVIFVSIKSRDIAREELEDEAEDASDELMPNANGTRYGTT